MSFKVVICFILQCYLFIIIHWPTRHARRYSCISDDKVIEVLIKENLKIRDSNLRNCDYQNVIYENKEYSVPNRGTFYNYKRPNLGDLFINQFNVSSI